MNLDKIKENAKMLFDLFPIKTVRNLPIVQHPFTNHPYVVMRVEKEANGKFDFASEFVDVTTKDGTKKFRDMIFKTIEEAKNIFQIITMMNSAYYMLFMKLIENCIDNKELGELLGETWITQEYPNRDKNVNLRTMVKWFKNADKETLMSEEELQTYNDLKCKCREKNIVVYRGVSFDGKPSGLSWTTDIEKARWFANRWETKGTIYKKIITNENDILAYFSGRNENEVIVNTFSATNYEIIKE